MSANKTIINLQKQNDSIYNSLIAKGLNFERIFINCEMEETEQIKLLNEENAKLKELIKLTRPAPQPKENNVKQDKQDKQDKQVKQVQSNLSKTNKDNNENDEDDEETFDEPIKKFNIIANMEEIKRAFFNGEYNEVEEQLKSIPFKFFKANYKYNSDKDGAPEYSATNLLEGFVRSFDDYRKYFLICFRCWKLNNNNTYLYDSYWIVNSDEPISNIIGSTCEDFEFEEIHDSNLLFNQIKKKLSDSEDCVYGDNSQSILIGENFVH
jgi:hypothetical protein